MIAPVRRTLVASWIVEGLSSVAKMEGKDSGSSMGPSSGIDSAIWASHGPELVGKWAETERE